ncbi:hypothetical protein [Azospirillum rugosum]|uniref:Uncharacterized protein n=1 Tax=Azospirillum rugosum TaxID=416170 RepID=A0ABS4SDT7_9PROT|nr:hypothetical protein [Azospirillum rugosum]MBP2290746.1 hypothetical protein [Azospirillum rugosum]MDQ0525635.1 hypothetical protein [Azospirillum rugosum]
MSIPAEKHQRIRETYKQLGAEVLAAIHGVSAAEIRAIVRGPKAANVNAPQAVGKPAPVAENPFQAPQSAPTMAQVQKRSSLREQVGSTGYLPLMSDAYRRKPQ